MRPPPRPSSPPWRPSLGAWPEAGGVRFRVWAPARRRVDLVLEDGPPRPMDKQADGTFHGFVPGLSTGARYRYRLDEEEGPFPDPVSRFQPEGVHGPSEVVDPGSFPWSDAGWSGLELDDAVFYELHVGTFTPEGTFAAAMARLPYLRDLGVTAVELMPIADFPGARNWGYDGVSLFAPARCYGRPDDLRRFVDHAHALGLAVALDVVYNHFGPDGAYQGAFSPYYFSDRHFTPWGQAINLDGPHRERVREYFVENASHWVREYHVDGLRLDATHALVDESPRHFLAELTSRVKAVAPEREVLVVAEDHRNLAHMVRPQDEGGWGLDAVWADDLHHQMRRGLAGDSDGYFRDFTGNVRDLAETIQDGWFFKGQRSEHLDGPRGTDPAGLRPRRFVVCLQNHDQVGNRALGERLSHQVDLAAYRAASVLLLCAPETPLLFMGQEWAASSPFLFFTDHNKELGRLVTEGRRREFQTFAGFSDPAARERIPDPQAEETFRRSRLVWPEAEREPHASTRRLYQALLRLRREEPLLRTASWEGFAVRAGGDSALVLARHLPDRGALAAFIQLRGESTVGLRQADVGPGGGRWSVVLDTEDPSFSPDAVPVDVDLTTSAPRVRFRRPGAVVLRLS
ncbi:MAG TPA: malto-oligosyltrehalose trehalohydrolase [Vicinamibacteria bacterium]|nr:malto-oligosyltrehalose trehalohydrolase [Vicinamibacteria bacterium]